MPWRNDASLAAAELALFVEQAALGTGGLPAASPASAASALRLLPRMLWRLPLQGADASVRGLGQPAACD